MIGPSFEAVLAAAVDGDELAFGVLWRDLQPGLLRYLNALAPGAGEDLASETWVRVAARLGRFSGDERAFRAWVFTVARHRAVDRWRRGARRRDELVPMDALVDLPAPDDPAGAALDAIATRAAVALIATLPPDQAEVVLLRVVAGLEVAEVAAITGKRPATSGSWPTGPCAAWPPGSARPPGSRERCNAMGAGDVFPAGMPDHPSHPMVPLDDDTAERLLAGRLDPEDAPLGYAEVAGLLQTVAGPPSPDELSGLEAALALFRTARRRPAPVRSRVVALALAGTLAVGGLWIADGAGTALGLGSPSGGPSSGGSGFGAPGSGWGSGTAAGSESLRPATAPVTGGQAPSSPSAGGRATDRHGRGVTARGGAPAHGVGPGSRGKPSKDEPPKGEAGKAKAGTDKPKAKPAKGKVAEA